MSMQCCAFKISSCLGNHLRFFLSPPFSRSLVRETFKFPTFSTTSPLARMLSALSASERAIVGRSDTIPLWRASSEAAAADWREIPESLRSRSRLSRAATQFSPWVDHHGGSSSSVFAPRHVVARPVARFLRTEDSLRDAGRAAAVSSAAPDESSSPESCTLLTLQNSQRHEIGNPKSIRRVNKRQN